MKNLYIVILGLLALLSSCAKDNGNYDYKPKEQVTVSGLADSYTVISEKESLIINPEVSSSDPNAELEYLWGIYEGGFIQGYQPKLDTLAKTKNLNYAVKQTAKAWVLVYKITNKKSGYSQFFTSNINVSTEFTRGWYVAKDDGVNADLDLFLTPTAIAPTSKAENIYSKVNGAKLPGKVSMINFLSNYKTTVSGTLASTRILFLTTDKDAASIYINNLKKVQDFSSLFYGTPTERNPSSIFASGGGLYLINNGQLYANSYSGQNDGRLGAKIMRDGNNTNYNLSKYFLPGIIILSDPFFFDDLNSSFVSMKGSGSTMSSTADAAGTMMPANNNNQKLLYMATKQLTPPFMPGVVVIQGYGIFQDKTNPNLKTLSQISGYADFKIKLTKDEILPSEKLFNATMHTLLFGDENILYFAVGNEIYSRNLSNKAEKLEFTLPAGEELTFMRHKKYSENTAYSYNYVIIGSKSGANYKVRMFNKLSGSLSPNPQFTLEGTGIPRDVIYISPSVTHDTYNPSY